MFSLSLFEHLMFILNSIFIISVAKKICFFKALCQMQSFLHMLMPYVWVLLSVCLNAEASSSGYSKLSGSQPCELIPLLQTEEDATNEESFKSPFHSVSLKQSSSSIEQRYRPLTISMLDGLTNDFMLHFHIKKAFY